MSPTSESLSPRPLSWSELSKAVEEDVKVLDEAPRGAPRAEEYYRRWEQWSQAHSAATVQSTIMSRTLLLGHVIEHRRGLSTNRQTVLNRQIARLRVSLLAMESVLKRGREASSAQAVEENARSRRA